MFIIPTLWVLFTYVFWRPHEIFEALRPITIYAVVAFSLFGYTLDLRVGATRPRGSALTGLLAALVLWCVVTVAVRAPETLSEQLARFGVSFVLFLLVSEGVQSWRAFTAIAGILLAFTLALSAVGFHQGLSQSYCFSQTDPVVDPSVNGASAEPAEPAEPRPCDVRADCYVNAPAGSEFMCEHVGVLGTHSIGGRVRYRGILEDPNELSWVLCMGMPLALGFFEQRRSWFRGLVLVATLVLAGGCTIMTQSRGGQLAMSATAAVYFIRRYRWRGVAVGALVALPLLLLGGRSGGEAESSSEERLGCWSEALSMFREYPTTGVGAGQFTEHHFLTAHNSFLLTLAELGPIGFGLWTLAIYFAFKITIRVQLELGERPEARIARIWAVALLASLVGLVVSAFFLSIAYHTALWIYLGLTASFYATVRRNDPDFRVRLTWRDILWVGAGDTVLIAAIWFYLRLQGF
jgi:O-Antigen ligase